MAESNINRAGGQMTDKEKIQLLADVLKVLGILDLEGAKKRASMIRDVLDKIEG